jgi:glutathione synthase/RimK-type ligase-like ATP-grasp enzyme
MKTEQGKSMRIALVNCVTLPEPDPDEAPLLDALHDAGHHGAVAAWDDPAVDWNAFDAAVIRATWNYHRHLGDFRDWLARVHTRTRLINPCETVLWNLHKKYLNDLEDRRIPIVPTAWAERGGPAHLAAIAERRGWPAVVVKPAVSAGSRDTRVFDLANGVDAAQEFLDESIAREDTMVQKFLPSVERAGEISVICLGGLVSHAIEKRPRFAGQAESILAHPVVSEAERRFAEAVVSVCPVPAVYARVDIMTGDDGEILLSELELIEPSLYFEYAPASAALFVQALEHTLAPA